MNLTGANNFSGVRRIEISDPIVGGEPYRGGVLYSAWNAAMQGLTDRTVWLKNKLENLPPSVAYATDSVAGVVRKATRAEAVAGVLGDVVMSAEDTKRAIESHGFNSSVFSPTFSDFSDCALATGSTSDNLAGSGARLYRVRNLTVFWVYVHIRNVTSRLPYFSFTPPVSPFQHAGGQAISVNAAGVSSNLTTVYGILFKDGNKIKCELGPDLSTFAANSQQNLTLKVVMEGYIA